MFNKLAKLTNKAVGTVKSTIRGAGDGNARNNETVAEMKAFKEHVKLMIKELQECSQKMTATYLTLGKVLSQQLPRAYVNAAGGIEAFDPDAKMVGTGVNLETMQAAAAEMQSKVLLEVVKPLEAWLANFTAIKDRNHRCEDLSQELMVQRKTTAAAEESARDLQNKGHKSAEAAAQKARAEAEKTRQLQEKFEVMEAEIFNDMLVCTKEIQELRQYALVALQAMQACLNQSVVSFNTATPIHYRLPDRDAVGAGAGTGGAAGASVPAGSSSAYGTYAPPAQPSYEATRQGSDQVPETGPLHNPFAGAPAGGYYPPPPGGAPSAPPAPGYPTSFPPAHGGYGAAPPPGYGTPAWGSAQPTAGAAGAYPSPYPNAPQ